MFESLFCARCFAHITSSDGGNKSVSISIIPFCRWGTEHQKDQITQLVNCGAGIQTCAFLILIPIMLPFDELYVYVHFSCGIIAYEA